MQKRKVIRDTPLAEITLRKYEKPINLAKRDLIKKLCLSIGLLQPGDSRDVVVDVFHVILESKKPLTAEEVQFEVIKQRKRKKLPIAGVAGSNIRRQMKRLKDLFLIEKIKNQYRINENDKLHNIYNEKIKGFYLESITQRIEEYFKLIE